MWTKARRERYQAEVIARREFFLAYVAEKRAKEGRAEAYHAAETDFLNENPSSARLAPHNFPCVSSFTDTGINCPRELERAVSSGKLHIAIA